MPTIKHPSWRFRVWWFAMLLLHAVSIAYYYGVFWLYKKLLPRSNLAFQFRTYGIGIAESEYSKIANVHFGVVVVHSIFSSLMVIGTVQLRRLAFYPDVSYVTKRLAIVFAMTIRRLFYRTAKHRVITSRTLSSISRRSQDLADSLVRKGEYFFGREGPMGVDFVYFDHLLLARELVETTLQMYQAYRMTRLLPRHWLIRVYVALLVMNCWLLPILHRVYYHRHRLRRRMSLLCDVILDVLSSMGVSFIIFMSYKPQYTDPRLGFPAGKWFIDEWFTNLYQEFQLMVVVSWWDMASRLVFAFGVLQGMNAIKDMLKIEEHDSDTTPNRLHQVLPNTGLSTTLKKEMPRLIGPSVIKPVSHSMVHILLHVVAPGLFVLWGTVILGIHVFAESQRSSWPCKLPLKPWLNSRPACSLLEINCQKLNAADLSAADWAHFDPALAAGLRVRHCSNLAMPTTVKNLTSVVIIKIYNSSIVSWPDEAALTGSSHPNMRVLFLVRTDLPSGLLPPGLTSDQHPATLRRVISSVSNLKALPDDLDRKWPHGMMMVFEFSKLTSLPESLVRLQPGSLSFAHSPIRSLPHALFEVPVLANLMLSYTALQELPRNVTKPSRALGFLFLEGTNVTTFWSWMDPIILYSLSFKRGYFNAHGTPYCVERAQILNGTRSAFSTFAPNSGQAAVMDVSTPAKLAFTKTAVACAADFNILRARRRRQSKRARLTFPRLSSKLCLMFIDGTNIPTFWSWMYPLVRRSVRYIGHFHPYGTSYYVECAEIMASSLTSFTNYVASFGQVAVMDVSTSRELPFPKAAVVWTPDYTTYTCHTYRRAK